MNELESKRKLLKEIDKNFEVNFYPEDAEYTITHNKVFFQNIPWGGFTKEVVDHIRRIVYINRHGSIEDEIDEKNLKIEQENQRKQDEMIHETAKDVGKPLYELLR